MSNVLACDVDLTVVDSLTPWLDWFYQKTGQNVLNTDGKYDLVPEMKELIIKSGASDFDPFSFWRHSSLYDDLKPLEGCVEALSELSLMGFDILFVSSCVPEHTQSKINFLNKHFPFHSGFISTKDKHFVDYDILIDDKMEHMYLGESYRPDSKHILFTGCRVDGKPGEANQFVNLSSWGSLVSLN
jgi:5'(3')-deoxyribonucleotidase